VGGGWVGVQNVPPGRSNTTPREKVKLLTVPKKSQCERFSHAAARKNGLNEKPPTKPKKEGCVRDFVMTHASAQGLVNRE